jgi:hypothetical protein
MNTTTVTMAKPRELERLLTLSFGRLAVVAQHGDVHLRGEDFRLQPFHQGQGLARHGHRVGAALLGHGDRHHRVFVALVGAGDLPGKSIQL